MTELVIGAFSPSVLLRTARRTGVLAARGLEVTESLVPSSPAQFRALAAGEFDAVLTSPDNVVAYRFVPGNPLAATFDVSIVAAVDRGLGLGLYARPGLRTADQLRGAVVAVDVATSGFAFVLYALMESLGLTRGDYELVEMGSTPRRLQALLAGRCDATMLNAGNELLAEVGGSSRLARVVDVAAPYLGTVLAVGEHPAWEPVRELAAACRETAAAIVSGEAHAAAVSEAESALGMPTDVAERYVAGLGDADEGLVVDGVVDEAALATIVGLRRRFSPVAADGPDELEHALDPGSGLVDPESAAR